MKLAFGNSWGRVVEGDRGEQAWLHDYVACKNLVWAGNGAPEAQTFSMFNLDLNLLAAGLVPTVARGAREAGVQLEIQDERVVPSVRYPLADIGWLRDYQKDAAQVAARAGRGLIKAPTGSGKTEVAIALTRLFPDIEWLFTVHRVELVAQFARRFTKRTGEQVGHFSEGKWTRGTANVTVSTFQSIYRAMEAGPGPVPGIGSLMCAVKGLLVDEVHAQPAETYYAVTQGMNDAYYRFGLSGTPLNREEKDSLRTLGAIGPLIYRIPTQLLIDRGILSPAKIRMLPCEQQAGHAGSDFRQVYDELVVKSPTRNAAVLEAVQRAAKPCLVFVSRVKHGYTLHEMLRNTTDKVAFAQGKDSLSSRAGKLASMAQNMKVLICTSIFQEGIDIPELRSVVNAAGGASEVAAIQRMGRGMRTYSGKKHFELWDIMDSGQKWLAEHAWARKGAYESEGHTVEIVTE